MEKLLVTTREAFEAIGVGRSKGFQILAAGELETVKIGSAMRVTTSSIRAYVDKLRGHSEGEPA